MDIQTFLQTELQSMPTKKAKSADDMPAPACEKCGSRKVVPIVWGRPMPETFAMCEKYEKEHGEPPIWIGGCCVTDNDPKWHCLACGHEFGLANNREF